MTTTSPSGGRLARQFFERYTPLVARELLGCILVRVLGRSVLSGRIVEAEAYRGGDDPASHAYRGMTKRNAVMFGMAGRAYVYFSFGVHWCFNITTEEDGTPAAVLVRAMEPTGGTERMMKRRGVSEVTEVANGPGKLTQAMSIGRGLNGEDLVTSKRLYLLRGDGAHGIGSSTRVGISSGAEYAWRYFISGSPFVSRGALGAVPGSHVRRNRGRRTHNYRGGKRSEKGVVC